MKVVRIDQRVEVLSPTSRRMVLLRDRQAREVLQTTFRPDYLSNRGAHRVGRLDVAIIWDGRLGRMANYYFDLRDGDGLVVRRRRSGTA